MELCSDDNRLQNAIAFLVQKFKQLRSCCLIIFAHFSLNDSQYCTGQFERSSRTWPSRKRPVLLVLAYDGPNCLLQDVQSFELKYLQTLSERNLPLEIKLDDPLFGEVTTIFSTVNSKTLAVRLLSQTPIVNISWIKD